MTCNFFFVFKKILVCLAENKESLMGFLNTFGLYDLNWRSNVDKIEYAL